MVLGFRWRRDIWLVGSVVLAIMIVGSAAVHRSPPGTPAAAPESPAAPQLPTEGGVGAAELVYSCVRGCRPLVLLTNLREFEVPTDAPTAREVTLSPDGRWLGYPLGSGFVLRDLIGRDEYRLGSRTVSGRLAGWAWAPDSSMLLLAELRDGQPLEYVLQNLTDGRRTPVVRWPGHDLLGVRRPLDLLSIRPGAASGTRVDVELANEAGHTTGSTTVDASDQLRPGERIEPTSLRFTLGMGYEVVVLRTGDDQPVAVLRFGGGGAGIGRHDLTEPGQGQWSVLGVGERGRGFVRSATGRTSVWYLGPDGTFRAGRDLPGEHEVTTPGTAWN